MEIIFFGSSDFAVPVLEKLVEKEEVLLVVTQPDRKKGRYLKISSTAVMLKSKKLGIKVFQPEDVNSEDSVHYLRKLDADVFIVVSFGQILKKRLLDIPRLFSLNVHASLLPKYRGAAPINWALANGERETGVTIIRMNEKMDGGDIILKAALAIQGDDDAVTLSERLSKKGASLLLDSIALVGNKKVDFLKQDDSDATYAPKLKKEDGLIDWHLSAEQLYNRIRAFVPWPGCFTYWNGMVIKIWKAEFEESFSYRDIKPGIVLKVSKDSILISTGNGVLRVKELQLENKRRMKVEEFVIGHKDMLSGSVFSLHR